MRAPPAAAEAVTHQRLLWADCVLLVASLCEFLEARLNRFGCPAKKESLFSTLWVTALNQYVWVARFDAATVH
jgi:hypothetical protein